MGSVQEMTLGRGRTFCRVGMIIVMSSCGVVNV